MWYLTTSRQGLVPRFNMVKSSSKIQELVLYMVGFRYHEKRQCTQAPITPRSIPPQKSRCSPISYSCAQRRLGLQAYVSERLSETVPGLCMPHIAVDESSYIMLYYQQVSQDPRPNFIKKPKLPSGGICSLINLLSLSYIADLGSDTMNVTTTMELISPSGYCIWAWMGWNHLLGFIARRAPGKWIFMQQSSQEKKWCKFSCIHTQTLIRKLRTHSHSGTRRPVGTVQIRSMLERVKLQAVAPSTAPAASGGCPDKNPVEIYKSYIAKVIS